MATDFRRIRWYLVGAVVAVIGAICVPIPVQRYLSGEGSPASGSSRGSSSGAALQSSHDVDSSSNADGSQQNLLHDDDLDDDDEVEGSGDDEGVPPPVPPKVLTPAGSKSDVDSDGNRGREAEDSTNLFSQLQSSGEGNGQESSPLSSDFFGAVRVGRGGGGIVATPAPQASTTPEPDPIPWVSGQARGYTMLYAMQPEARVVVEKQIDALISAKLREVHIGVLIDGTFGRDVSYLQSVIQRLSEGGRSLTLTLYLSNGPTMRKWRETRMQFLFSNIEPVEFRRRIRSDRGLRGQYADLVGQAREIFDFSRARNPENRNVAVVMLEDNLDADSYRAMRALASERLGASASFVRNPCIGCYRGNDDSTLGDAREEHTLERFPILSTGDAYSLDGVGFSYPNAPGGVGLNSGQLLDLMRACAERGLQYVGLWRHEWQGIQGSDNPPASERVYVPSDDDQLRFEIRALREGLVAEESDTEDGDEDSVEFVG